MDLEPDPFGCKFDALVIHDFGQTEKKDKYCGTKPYFPIVSKEGRKSYPNLFLEFIVLEIRISPKVFLC